MSEEEEDESKDLSEEQEEKEEQEEEEDNDKKNLPNDSNKENKKTHSYYLSIITKLQSEIESEKKKMKSQVEKKMLNEQQLQNELNKKNVMLTKLQATGRKQKKALDDLTSRLNEEDNKNKANKLSEKDENTYKSNERKSIKWEENKELDNATKTMKELRMENIFLVKLLFDLVKLLFENKDYTDSINLENLNKEMKEQLDQKTEEKNLLIEQLKSHLECKEEQKQLKEEMKTLINQLKDIKSKIQDKKDKIEELEFQNNKNIISYFSIDNFSKFSEIYRTKNSNKKSIKLNISTPNIHKNQINYNISNNKKIKLPLILPKVETILTEEFYNKVKSNFINDEKGYNDLIQKIKYLETKKKNTEHRNRNEINEKIARLNSLDEKYKILNLDKKFSVFNSHILKNQVNVFVTNNQKILKKLKDLKKELLDKKNISQKKNEEISQLQKQIKNIRELVGLCKINVEDNNNIKKYIDEIKKAKQKEEKKLAHSKEEIKNNNFIRIKKNKDEESIQPDNFYDKNNNRKKKKKKKK